jgi:hypothetical protein
MLKIVSFSGLVATFIVAYACDRWVESLRVVATQPFAIASYLWFAGVANLLIAIAILLLLWYVVIRADKSAVVSLVFVLVGLGLTFTPAIEMFVASTLPPLGIMEFLTPNSHVLYVAAFTTIIGVAGFVFPIRHST